MTGTTARSSKADEAAARISARRSTAVKWRAVTNAPACAGRRASGTRMCAKASWMSDAENEEGEKTSFARRGLKVSGVSGDVADVADIVTSSRRWPLKF